MAADMRRVISVGEMLLDLVGVQNREPAQPEMARFEGIIAPLNSCWRTSTRLAESGIAPSVGSQGDAYDDALAESLIGLFKTEVIQRCGPWRHLEAVEWATLT